MKQLKSIVLLGVPLGAISAVLALTHCASTGEGPVGGNVCDPAVERAEKQVALALPKAGPRVKVDVIIGTQPSKKVDALVTKGAGVDYGVVESDIVVAKVSDGRALATSLLSRRWKGGVIPYEFEPGFAKRELVLKAMKEWEDKTVIQFRPRVATDVYFVPIKRGTNANIGLSSIGRVGPNNQVFDIGDNCDYAVILHEIGHTIGLLHEQMRPDRDKYICVKWSRIKSGFADQFDLALRDTIALGPYGFDSIMHYFDTAFSVDGKPVMFPKDPKNKITGQKSISKGDAEAVDAMYAGI